jgi:hypothetical protein
VIGLTRHLLCVASAIRYAKDMQTLTEAAVSSPSLKVFVAALAAAFVLGTPANAEKARKYKKDSTVSKTARPDTYHRGTNLVPGGPLYFSGVYLGDDPDPNIRFQLMRDISGRLGGDP